MYNIAGLGVSKMCFVYLSGSDCNERCI